MVCQLGGDKWEQSLFLGTDINENLAVGNQFLLGHQWKQIIVNLLEPTTHNYISLQLLHISAHQVPRLENF